MGAKVYADRLTLEPVPVGAASPEPCHDVAASGPKPRAPSEPEAAPEPPSSERELEADVQAVAAWFDALPAEWRSYFDREAESGQRAYGRA